MSALDLIRAARDDDFAARIGLILMKSCINVANEDPATANHANRLALAQRHIKAELNTKAIAAAVIASNATIQSAIEGAPASRGSNVVDGDLEFALNGLVDMLANAYAAPV